MTVDKSDPWVTDHFQYIGLVPFKNTEGGEEGQSLCIWLSRYNEGSEKGKCLLCVTYELDGNHTELSSQDITEADFCVFTGEEPLPGESPSLETA